MQKWKGLRAVINQAVQNRNISSRNRRKLRPYHAKYELLDTELLKIVREKREKGLHVNEAILRRNVRHLFPLLYPDTNVQFKASNGFINRFMKRNGLGMRRVTGVGQKIPDNAPELYDAFLGEMMAVAENL